MVGSVPLLYVDVVTSGGNGRANDVKTSKRHTDVMHESRLTPIYVRRHFLAPVGFTESPVGYARM